MKANVHENAPATTAKAVKSGSVASAMAAFSVQSPLQQQIGAEDVASPANTITKQHSSGGGEIPVQNETLQLKTDPVQKQGSHQEEDLWQKKPHQLKTMQLPQAVPGEPKQGKQLQPFKFKAGPIQKQTANVVEKPAPKRFVPVQKKANNTGLPDNLKAGVEKLSGFSMADVNVHYNSVKPAQLQALAYAQGTDIHLGPGQEQHLPHEAWHVVQQMQGRVQPTLQLKQGVAVNDDKGLEHEADVMGAIAAQSAVAKGIENDAPYKPAMLIGLPVQRTLLVHKPSVLDKPTAEQVKAKEVGEKIDVSVNAAYQEFMNGNLSGCSAAQEALYVLRKSEYDDAKKNKKAYSMHPSTSAGYVIEGKANSKIAASVPNVKTQSTGALKGTRPDLHFKVDGTDLEGLMDITAANSAGHIFNKKGNWTNHKNIVYVAETLYPSINFDKMEPLTLTKEQMEEIRARADVKAAELKETYDAWAEKYASAQSSTKIFLVFDFNRNNKVPFKGTATQADRIAGLFRNVGMLVSLTKGSAEISLQGARSFDEMSDPDKLVPFKVDEAKADRLITLLGKNDMGKLLAG